jgi:TRAP-type transport system small permease protein
MADYANPDVSEQPPGANRRSLSRALSVAQSVLRFAGGIFLVALALLTLLDVLGRYVFSIPVKGAVELTEAIMVGIIFTGILLATQARQHVTVDLFAMRLGARGRRIQQGFGLLMAAGVSLLLGAVTWSQALSAQEFGDKTTMLGLPMAPLVFFMSACLFLNAIVEAVQCWKLFTARPEFP